MNVAIQLRRGVFRARSRQRRYSKCLPDETIPNVEIAFIARREFRRWRYSEGLSRYDCKRRCASPVRRAAGAKSAGRFRAGGHNLHKTPNFQCVQILNPGSAHSRRFFTHLPEFDGAFFCRFQKRVQAFAKFVLCKPPLEFAPYCDGDCAGLFRNDDNDCIAIFRHA